MTPYYQDDAVTIYHGDCREVLPSLTFDAVVTDPPYGTGHYATDTTVLTGSLLAEWVTRCPVAVFGWAERLVQLCMDAATVPDEWVTWWPTNGAQRGFNRSGLWRESESIAVFGAHTFSALREARSTKSQIQTNYAGVNTRIVSHGATETRHVGDVWTDAAPGLGMNSHLRQHPNEKPIGVMLRLVAAMSVEESVVVDPFMGSGTTLRAAKDLGRRCIGIEAEERYCEIAAKRMGQEVLDFGGAA